MGLGKKHGTSYLPYTLRTKMYFRVLLYNENGEPQRFLRSPFILFFRHASAPVLHTSEHCL